MPLTDTAPPWDHADHPETNTPSDKFANEYPPFPTNVWWQNMVNDGDLVNAALPYIVRTTTEGLHVGLPGKV